MLSLNTQKKTQRSNFIRKKDYKRKINKKSQKLKMYECKLHWILIWLNKKSIWLQIEMMIRQINQCKWHELASKAIQHYFERRIIKKTCKKKEEILSFKLKFFGIKLSRNLKQNYIKRKVKYQRTLTLPILLRGSSTFCHHLRSHWFSTRESTSKLRGGCRVPKLSSMAPFFVLYLIA